MNSDGGRCHDNARCEAMWARMKEELLYGRYDTKKMTVEELKPPDMEILYHLLEQSEDMLSQWRSASNAQKETVL